MSRAQSTERQADLDVNERDSKDDKKPDPMDTALDTYASKSTTTHREKTEHTSVTNKKWTILEHNGVVFPPPYKPHGVKMLYDNVSIVLPGIFDFFKCSL